MAYKSVTEMHSQVSQNGLSMFHLNCRSIVNKLDDIREIVRESFDFLMFTETWFKSFDNTDCFSDYHAFLLNRDDGYGGVALYAKTSLACSVVDEFTLSNSYFEVLSLAYHKYVICCAYRRHSEVEPFIEYLDSLMSYCAVNDLSFVNWRLQHRH
jgi:exonuclease III